TPCTFASWAASSQSSRGIRSPIFRRPRHAWNRPRALCRSAGNDPRSIAPIATLQEEARNATKSAETIQAALPEGHDQAAQGQGLGEALLIDAFRRTLAVSESLGVHAVEVDAIDEQAKAFYEKYGFVTLTGQPLRLYLPIATIRKALDPG